MQDKHFSIAIINMFKDLKDMNKCFNENKT